MSSHSQFTDSGSMMLPTAVPKFHSRLPEALLKNVSEVERTMLIKLDINEQQNEWMMREQVEIRRQVTKTNGRVTALEDRADDSEVVVNGVRRFRHIILWLLSAMGAVLLWLADKLATRWLSVFAMSVALLSCSGCHSPRAAAVQHVRPDVGPVQRPVAQTRLAIAETQTAVRNASATVTQGSVASLAASKKATVVAMAAADAARNGLAAKSAEAEALASQTADLLAEVKGLQIKFAEAETQLRVAEAAAAAAEARSSEAEVKLAEFDAKVAAQTEALNQREVELANERAAKAAAAGAQHKAESALRALRWKIALWTTLAVLFLAGSFYFKLLRIGL